jgi:hypothetical protein
MAKFIKVNDENTINLDLITWILHRSDGSLDVHLSGENKAISVRDNYVQDLTKALKG